MMVNLHLIESDTWICLKDGHINETIVKAGALDIDLTDVVIDVVNKFNTMVEAVPIPQRYEREVMSNEKT